MATTSTLIQNRLLKENGMQVGVYPGEGERTAVVEDFYNAQPLIVQIKCRTTDRNSVTLSKVQSGEVDVAQGQGIY